MPPRGHPAIVMLGPEPLRARTARADAGDLSFTVAAHRPRAPLRVPALAATDGAIIGWTERYASASLEEKVSAYAGSRATARRRWRIAMRMRFSAQAPHAACAISAGDPSTSSPGNSEGGSILASAEVQDEVCSQAGKGHFGSHGTVVRTNCTLAEHLRARAAVQRRDGRASARLADSRDTRERSARCCRPSE